MVTHPEETLIQLATEGDVDAFSQLVRLHQSRVRAFLGQFLVVRSDVDDVAQDTFLAAFRSLGEYDASRPFRSWLYGIARNQALMHMRKESARLRREDARLQAAVLDWTAESAAQQDGKATEQLLQRLEGCLGRLAPQSAEAVRQYYFHAQSARDLAQLYNRSELAVRLWMLRIRQQLRSCLEQPTSAGRA